MSMAWHRSNVACRFVAAGVVPVLLGLSLALLGGCIRQGTRVGAALPDPKESAAAAIQTLDTDSDGQISGAELDKSPGLKAGLSRIDRDGSGGISEAEIRQHLQEYHDTGLSLMSLDCRVAVNGKQVPGINVTLTPEPFLGEEIKPAHGVTDSMGACMLVAEGAKRPGVQIGLYRISVSRKDDRSGQELIAARYNEETELGVEVSNAASDEIGNGLLLAVKTR